MTTNTKIAFTSGHNPKSRGKARFGTTEFEFAEDFLDDLMPLLNNIEGISVKRFARKYCGPYSYYKEMDDLHARIDAWGANIDVELHYNASASKATGHEVLYYTKSKGGALMARSLESIFAQFLPTRNRGAKSVGYGERGSYGLKCGASKSLIAEPFFSKEVNDYIVGGKHRDKLLNAYVAWVKSIASLDTKTAKISQKRNAQIDLIEDEYQAALALVGELT